MPRFTLACALLVACSGGEDDTPDKKPPVDCVDFYPDDDLDGYGRGDSEPERVCDGSTPSGFVANAEDCDDADPSINPDADELCDLLGNDENCNGLIDDADPAVVGTVDTFPDEDGDGYGVPGAIVKACINSPGRSRNQDDCDDTDGTVFPGAGDQEADPTLCMQDADGDGYGSAEPTNSVAVPGTDCDDGAASTYPDAVEIFGDGLDQDCDGFDLWSLEDDFELGSPDPAVFPGATGDQAVLAGTVHTGLYALNMGGGGATVTSIGVDTTSCSGGAIDWSFWVKRGPETPDTGDNLRFEFYDGASWRLVGQVLGQGVTDADFIEQSGSLTDPGAFGPGARFRFVSNGSGSGTDDFFIDDVSIVCAGPDGDGDGFGANLDCDDGDPAHWADCGLCTDGDGDGFGTGCDLGGDCDDSDAAVQPGSPDPLGDGIDQDCSGLDGVGFLDDFELGVQDPFVWSSLTGEGAVQSTTVGAGAWALTLGSAGSEIVTAPMDTSSCGGLAWGYTGLRGPDAPEVGDFLDVEYWDGTAWVQADRWPGTGSLDAAWQPRGGPIVDAAAFAPGFRLRLVASGGSPGLDHFHVDDVILVCDDDNDGDGYVDGADCAPADPAHWLDCGACTDGDGDGYGAGCDLGVDCSDGDPLTYPGAPDPLGDGTDTNCDGVDGTGLFDDFESGALDPSTWASITGDATYELVTVFAGTYSLNLGGGGSTAESVTIDTTSCSSVTWAYQGKRGPETPDSGDDLVLEWWDGVAWAVADTYAGAGTTDATFSLRQGVIAAPAALWSGFKIRFVSNGSGAGTDDFFIDDLLVGCTGDDSDGDGVAGAFDCDDSDPLHWSDCGLCTDLDGDGFGNLCDLGTDCAPTDPSTHPGATDVYGDGIDSDCSGVDGPGMFDDFEDGAPGPQWASIIGDYGYDTTTVYAGTYSLNLGGGGATAESNPIDTTACATVLWGYQAKRGPEVPDVNEDLVFEWYDGSVWVEADRHVADSVTDPAFVERTGEILDALAYSTGFRVRLSTSGSGVGSDDHFIDDLFVVCGLGDGDGDGVDAALDCDDSDAWHWSDCGLCVDLDLDGFGLDCDLGADCDDADDTTYPGALDVLGDGIDNDCSGVDGVGFIDDFEDGVPAFWWDSMTGDITFDATYYASGALSLNLGGGAGTATSQVLDTTACVSIDWEYLGKRGPEVPDTGDDLVLSFESPVGWVPFDTFAGTGVTDPTFSLRAGSIVSPGAFWSGFRVRLESNGSGTNTDDFFIDDLAVICQ